MSSSATGKGALLPNAGNPFMTVDSDRWAASRRHSSRSGGTCSSVVAWLPQIRQRSNTCGSSVSIALFPPAVCVRPPDRHVERPRSGRRKSCAAESDVAHTGVDHMRPSGGWPVSQAVGVGARSGRRARHRRGHHRGLLHRQRAAHELLAGRRNDAVPRREELELGRRLRPPRRCSGSSRCSGSPRRSGGRTRRHLRPGRRRGRGRF
jgi:hypothetical protein